MFGQVPLSALGSRERAALVVKAARRWAVRAVSPPGRARGSRWARVTVPEPGTARRWARVTVPKLGTARRWARVTVPKPGTARRWATGTVSELVPVVAILLQRRYRVADCEKPELKFELAARCYGFPPVGAMSPQGYQHWFAEYCWAGQLLERWVAAAQTWVKQH